MADVVLQHNIGAYGNLRRVGDHSTATAGGTGASTSVTCTAVDRMGFSTGALPQTAVFGVAYEATLGSGNTISHGYSIQSSPDNSTWTDYQTATWAVTDTGGSGGTTQKGCFDVAVDLTNAQRYVRIVYNPKFSAGSTDTYYGDAVGFFAGYTRLAAPAN